MGRPTFTKSDLFLHVLVLSSLTKTRLTIQAIRCMTESMRYVGSMAKQKESDSQPVDNLPRVLSPQARFRLNV